jgi:hypothetical protein
MLDISDPNNYAYSIVEGYTLENKKGDIPNSTKKGGCL